MFEFFMWLNFSRDNYNFVSVRLNFPLGSQLKIGTRGAILLERPRILFPRILCIFVRPLLIFLHFLGKNFENRGFLFFFGKKQCHKLKSLHLRHVLNFIREPLLPTKIFNFGWQLKKSKKPSKKKFSNFKLLNALYKNL